MCVRLKIVQQMLYFLVFKGFFPGFFVVVLKDLRLGLSVIVLQVALVKKESKSKSRTQKFKIQIFNPGRGHARVGSQRCQQTSKGARQKKRKHNKCKQEIRTRVTTSPGK